jgi:tRNA A37 methylthiotransferase MiaB
MPDCAISTDIIAGFCGKRRRPPSHAGSLIRESGLRHGLHVQVQRTAEDLAARKHEDDVPEEVKGRRLAEIIDSAEVEFGEADGGLCGPNTRRAYRRREQAQCAEHVWAELAEFCRDRSEAAVRRYGAKAR